MGSLTYLAVNCVVLLVVVLASWRYLGRLGRAFTIGLAGLLLLTLIFDNLLIALSVYAYTPDTHLGILLGLAPLEDFFYPVVSMIIVAVLWTALPSKQSTSSKTENS